MKERKCFQCDYCGKIRLTKQAMENHEEICFHNPARKACATCTYPYYLVDRDLRIRRAEKYENYEPERKCKQGHDISRSLTADCKDYRWQWTAGVAGWYTKFKGENEVNK